MDAWLEHRLPGLEADAAGNRILRIPGADGAARVALTAHKDEIGAMVKRIEPDGRHRRPPEHAEVTPSRRDARRRRARQ